jgi:archaellum component FlaC
MTDVKPGEERIPGTEDYQDDVNHDELYGDGDDYEDGGEGGGDDPELEDMKRRVEAMEEEQEKLSKLQQQVEKQLHSAADSIDENSVYFLCNSFVYL